jgi:hypothetical protein
VTRTSRGGESSAAVAARKRGHGRENLGDHAHDYPHFLERRVAIERKYSGHLQATAEILRQQEILANVAEK